MRWLLSLLLMGVFVGNAQASVEDADAHYERAEIREALVDYREALENGGHSREQLAHIYWRLGVTSTITGASAEARDAFERALALDPILRAPDELPPDSLVVYRELQQNARRITLRLRADSPSNSRPTTLELEQANVPAEFAGSFALSAEPIGGAPWTLEANASEGTLELPAAAWRGGEQLQVRVRMLDRYGNEIASQELALRSAPGATPLVVAPGDEEDDDASLVRNPWLWTGVGAVVVGAVLTAVLLSQRDTRFEGGRVDVIREAR